MKRERRKGKGREMLNTVMLTLGRLRQEDCYVFKANVGYIVRGPVSKNKNTVVFQAIL